MINHKIAKFIHDEVTRQGHVEYVDRTMRCIWMGQAWRYAQRKNDADLPITKPVIIKLGKLVEPIWNADGFRCIGVGVGGWEAPDPEEVRGLLDSWLKRLPGLVADEAYREYELIHPFRDGNGRTGKIIHNWLLNKLDEPVLVQDFFGHGVP